MNLLMSMSKQKELARKIIDEQEKEELYIHIH